MRLHNETKKNSQINLAVFCDPAGTRTQDPYIKSVLLYQLSYGIISFSFRSKEVQKYASISKNQMFSEISFRYV